MIDTQYHPLFDQAMDLQFKFHDFSAGQASHHPEARVIQNEIHQLVQDITVMRNPHSLEERIKTIQNQLKQTQHTKDPFMNYEHHDFMYDNFEHMRGQLRKFDNY